MKGYLRIGLFICVLSMLLMLGMLTVSAAQNNQDFFIYLPSLIKEPYEENIPTIEVVVISDRAVARHTDRENKAGFPIFDVWEGPDGEHVIYYEGDVVEVLPEAVIGDGGVKVWQLRYVEDDQPDLYLRDVDVEVVED